MQELFWVNGDSSSNIPADDRGLALADGVFETLRIEQGRVCLHSLHYDRLVHGLTVLGFPHAPTVATRAFNDVNAALASLDKHVDGSLRVTITRGSGPRGYSPPKSPNPRIILRFSEGLPANRLPMTLGVSGIHWSRQPYFAGAKLLARTEQVLAALDANRQGVDEVLMEDGEGSVCSTSTGNLFICKDDRLITPPIDHCGIEGTRRRYVIDTLAPALGIPVDITRVSVDDVVQADEVFACNSIRGVCSAASIGQRRFQSHPIATALAPLIHGGEVLPTTTCAADRQGEAGS